MLFDTKRLILRRITQEDYESWRQILSDPETMRYYPAPFDQAGVQRWIDWTMDHYARYGFGLWAVILKKTGEFIGDCGITMQNIHGQMLPEIGYHIHKNHWRKGYASEAARACRDYAFDTLHFSAVYSYMTSENVPSYGVAMKIGMQLVEEYRDEAHGLTRVYRITREEWENCLTSPSSDQIPRIKHMESILDESRKAIDELMAALEKYRQMRPRLSQLDAYYCSPQWMQDYQDDCDGRIPADLKRGVLSQDGVYDLLDRQRQVQETMRECLNKQTAKNPPV
ncbi:MAG: GNAT family N-acetyltransferase [Clostridiales bacterium]|nr:GNAT family N-acetyltransferase [Clostridiales bacterium]